MKAEDRYNTLIQYYWIVAEDKYKPVGLDAVVDWRLVKEQIRKESAFNPAAQNARSGALGLLQLMAATDIESDGKRDAANPEEAIREGVAYLWKQWNIFKKETGIERWKFALGAYNAGAGNIIKAQTIAEQRGWNSTQWKSIADSLIRVTGPANSAETTEYVATIIAWYRRIREGV